MLYGVLILFNTTQIIQSSQTNQYGRKSWAFSRTKTALQSARSRAGKLIYWRENSFFSSSISLSQLKHTLSEWPINFILIFASFFFLFVRLPCVNAERFEVYRKINNYDSHCHKLTLNAKYSNFGISMFCKLEISLYWICSSLFGDKFCHNFFSPLAMHNDKQSLSSKSSILSSSLLVGKLLYFVCAVYVYVHTASAVNPNKL